MKMLIIFVNWEIEFLVNYHLQAENQYFTNKTAVGIRIAIYINHQCVTYVGPENLGYPIVSNTPNSTHDLHSSFDTVKGLCTFCKSVLNQQL